MPRPLSRVVGDGSHARPSSRQDFSRDPEVFAFACHPVYPFILQILMNWSGNRPVVHRFRRFLPFIRDPECFAFH